LVPLGSGTVRVVHFVPLRVSMNGRPAPLLVTFAAVATQWRTAAQDTWVPGEKRLGADGRGSLATVHVLPFQVSAMGVSAPPPISPVATQ